MLREVNAIRLVNDQKERLERIEKRNIFIVNQHAVIIPNEPVDPK